MHFFVSFFIFPHYKTQVLTKLKLPSEIYPPSPHIQTNIIKIGTYNPLFLWFFAMWTALHYSVKLRHSQFGLPCYQGRDTKLDRFLDKTQHTQRKLLQFVNRRSAKMSKSAKFWQNEFLHCVRGQSGFVNLVLTERNM